MFLFLIGFICLLLVISFATGNGVRGALAGLVGTGALLFVGFVLLIIYILFSAV